MGFGFYNWVQAGSGANIVVEPACEREWVLAAVSGSRFRAALANNGFGR
jgi:hypothetical protein